MENIFEKMFQKIGEIIDIEEIAYLAIENGELIPIYKNNTEILSMEQWIKFHQQYRSFVKDSDFLMNLVETKKLCAIGDTDQLPTKPKEFQVLGIKSIYLFPVIKNEEVIGIVDIAFINKHYSLTKDQIHQCQEIIERNRPLLNNHDNK